MPFGKYAGKSVQAMSGLFNMNNVNGGFAYIGGLGQKGAKVAARGKEGELIALGKKRAAIAGGTVLGLGALGRTSGANGLHSKSSAPPPQNPYGGY